MYDNLLPGYVVAHLYMDGSSMVTCSHYNSPLFIGRETRDSYKMVSKCKEVEDVAIFLISYGVRMNILYIIKLKILMSLERLSYSMHTIQSLLHACLFGIHFWSHSNPHTPFKYVFFCNKKSNPTRFVYLSVTLPL